MDSKLDPLKQKYFSKALRLISKYGELNIVYLRVSTKKEDGQKEEDQWHNLEDTFELDKKKCLIIRAKESGYQLDKQQFRKFNIILDLLKELDNNIPKKCYFWAIDRIYRNRKLTEEFYHLAQTSNTKIYAFQERFINMIADLQGMLPPEMGFIIDMQVKNMVSIFAWLAEMESKKKADRLLKSLTKKDGRYYTNKGNLYGKKLKNSKGRKLKLTANQLTNLEKRIAKALKQEKTYNYIKQAVLEKEDIKISNGYIFNIKQKYL
jgi:DNA invertase Pin-like site-specific DNA recombinase